MCESRSRLFLALCCSAWLLAAGTSWAAEPSPGISPAQNPRPSPTESPRLTPLATVAFTERALSTSVDESAELTRRSEAHSQHMASYEADMAAYGLRLTTLRNEADVLKQDYASLLDTFADLEKSSEKAESSATEAILVAGQALARMTRSRDRWRTAAAGLAVAVVGYGVREWVEASR